MAVADEFGRARSEVVESVPWGRREAVPVAKRWTLELAEREREALWTTRHRDPRAQAWERRAPMPAAEGREGEGAGARPRAS